MPAKAGIQKFLKRLDSRFPGCVTIPKNTLCVIPANAGLPLFQALSKCIDSDTQAGMTIMTQSVHGNDRGADRLGPVPGFS
ncbi:MAG: hypothetical protein C4581_10715 [Nitrospiraceae bacterium]|nr:MAG: hypothetical protein C4581_10715 [Nitrospiraceae bacterium]